MNLQKQLKNKMLDYELQKQKLWLSGGNTQFVQIIKLLNLFAVQQQCSGKKASRGQPLRNYWHFQSWTMSKCDSFRKLELGLLKSSKGM